MRDGDSSGSAASVDRVNGAEMIRLPAQRRRLAGGARAYVAAGWPVAPGAWWDPAACRFRCAQSGCITTGLHPAPPDIHNVAFGRCQATVPAAVSDIGMVAERWGDGPYSVLLPTGEVCDAVEVRARVGRRLQALLAAYGRLGPVALYPDGTVLLITKAAGTAAADWSAEFAEGGAIHHGRGSWVPLPPTQLATGPMRWARSPTVAQWRLPSLDVVAKAFKVAAAALVLPPAQRGLEA